MRPPVLILHAPGTNRDGDLAHALRLAGGEPEIVPLSHLRQDEIHWQDYALLALPGGFSYGDALGAGRLWAFDLETWLDERLQAFVSAGRPVIGICNGFQALVKAGILPGGSQDHARRPATLTYNASGKFECRWVRLAPNPANSSPWLEELEPFTCPVAHGEGRFQMASGRVLPSAQVALTYTGPDGSPAWGAYPYNPNGSPGDVAGITNQVGNVLGLMPHPENHILPYQHPHWTRGYPGGLALSLIKNGLRMVS